MDSTALAVMLAIFGVLLLALSYQRHRHHRDISALLHGISGGLSLLGGSLLFTLALNFNTYASLRAGEPLAEISIEKATDDTWLLRLLSIPAGDLQVFSIQGDRWDVQARQLHWQGWARWFGLSDHLRLEQVNSMKTRTTRNGVTSGNVNTYALSDNPGIDIWALQERYPLRLSALQTRAAQTGSLTLQDGARFHLYWQNNELIARQINTPGRRSAQVTPTPAVTLPDFMEEMTRQSAKATMEIGDTLTVQDTADSTSASVSSANDGGSSRSTMD